MKAIKLFLIISFAFILGAILTSTFVWNKVQKTFFLESAELSETPVQTEASTISGSIAETVPDDGIPVPVDALSPTQKAVANKFGIDVDSFTITPAMVQCAEEKLGSSRITELMDGNTPTLLESASLVGCL